MTNSPPSNVKLLNNEPCRALASGIDSLSLAIQVEWDTDRAFKVLDALKKQAKATKQDESSRLEISSESGEWLFVVKPNGKEGCEWMIGGSEYSLKIGNWATPQQRPSIMADIRSETLWMHGPKAAVSRLLDIIRALGGKPVSVKSSSEDVCVDVLLPRSEWTRELEQHFVTRAHYVSSHINRGKLTGFSIGKGLVAARLYDKPEEIATKSGKFWMYDIWGIDDIAEDCVIIRVELQFRRERLKELGCDTWDDLQKNLPRLWAYGTQKWLRIVGNAKIHHTQQKVLPWWDGITNGFSGAQGAEPLVREKAIVRALRLCASQVIGSLSSIVAIEQEDEELDPDYPLDAESHLKMALEKAIKVNYISAKEFTKRVIRKQARFNRGRPGFRKSE